MNNVNPREQRLRQLPDNFHFDPEREGGQMQETIATS
jgi:hypothetical protein